MRLFHNDWPVGEGSKNERWTFVIAVLLCSDKRWSKTERAWKSVKKMMKFRYPDGGKLGIYNNRYLCKCWTRKKGTINGATYRATRVIGTVLGTCSIAPARQGVLSALQLPAVKHLKILDNNRTDTTYIINFIDLILIILRLV